MNQNLKSGNLFLLKEDDEHSYLFIDYIFPGIKEQELRTQPPHGNLLSRWAYTLELKNKLSNLYMLLGARHYLCDNPTLYCQNFEDRSEEAKNDIYPCCAIGEYFYKFLIVIDKPIVFTSKPMNLTTFNKLFVPVQLS